ncbi:hypothetical protein JCM33374_g726 [Metschnikowia sp. JCM 33374]|nr:hypothetical protein JCM33374_g726 [Metschnikowia sp. JCM 33374]
MRIRFLPSLGYTCLHQSDSRISIITCLATFAAVCNAINLPRYDKQHALHLEIFDSQSPSPNGNSDPVGDRLGQPDLHPSADHLAVGYNGMVSCDVPLCSEMGTGILKRGGNAADAAVTVALCIGSINSHSSGIGGGSYIISANAGETISIDAREMAPAKAEKNMYEKVPLLSQFGGLAVAVPGELAGLYKLHTLHGSGKLSWAELFEPVIELNEKGWSAPQIWVRALKKIHDLLLSRVKSLRESWDFVFRDGSSDLVDIGDLVKRPNLAHTLRIIAQNGSADPFYDPNGPIVPSLVKASKRLGGIIESSDFSSYFVDVKKALSFKFTHNEQEYEVLTTKGASSGIALVAGLNFYSSVNEHVLNPGRQPELETHRLIEAMKWTAAARSHLGDVNDTYYNEIVEKYSNSEWTAELLDDHKYSDNETFPWKHYGPLYEISGKHGTSHFSVVDSEGGAVGMTTTVNLLFGSSVYDNHTGIFLNNQMDDFSQPKRKNAFDLSPSTLNFIGPKKRPLSSMAPTIIKKNGEIAYALGCAGGSRISTAILQAIVRMIYWKVPLLETIAWPRIHHQLLPEHVMVERIDLFDEEYKPGDIVLELENRKHTLFESGALTAMNAIKRTNGLWEGVSDYWRKRGAASGY